MSPDERSEKSSLAQTQMRRGFQARVFLLAPQASVLLFTALCDDNIICESEMTTWGEKKAGNRSKTKKNRKGIFKSGN